MNSNFRYLTYEATSVLQLSHNRCPSGRNLSDAKIILWDLIGEDLGGSSNEKFETV